MPCDICLISHSFMKCSVQKSKQARAEHKVIYYNSLLPWLLFVLLRQEMLNINFDKQPPEVSYKVLNSLPEKLWNKSKSCCSAPPGCILVACDKLSSAGCVPVETCDWNPLSLKSTTMWDGLFPDNRVSKTRDKTELLTKPFALLRMP